MLMVGHVAVSVCSEQKNTAKRLFIGAMNLIVE
jgi:hypothetical protein